jgi:hypothetical protein
MTDLLDREGRLARAVLSTLAGITGAVAAWCGFEAAHSRHMLPDVLCEGREHFLQPADLAGFLGFVVSFALTYGISHALANRSWWSARSPRVPRAWVRRRRRG